MAISYIITTIWPGPKDGHISEIPVVVLVVAIAVMFTPFKIQWQTVDHTTVYKSQVKQVHSAMYHNPKGYWSYSE